MRHITVLTILVILLVTVGNNCGSAKALKKINMSKMMDDMKKFSKQYDPYSGVFRSYAIMFGKVKTLLRHKLKIIADRWKTCNMDSNSKTNLGNEIKNTIAALTTYWNNKCKEKFLQMVQTYGEKPAKPELKIAEEQLEKVAGSYIHYVVKKIDHFRDKIEQEDGGLFLDDLDPNVKPVFRLYGMWKDSNRIYAQFRSTLHRKMHQLFPFSKDHTPNKAEMFLLNRLQKFELKTWKKFRKEGKQMLKPKNKKKVSSIAEYKKGIEDLQEKEIDDMKDATEKMTKMVNKEKGLSGSGNKFKSKLLAQSLQYFKGVKDTKVDDFQSIIDQAANQVNGKQNAGNLVTTIGLKRTELLGNVEDAIANKVQKVSKDASKAKGSFHSKLAQGLNLVKDEIDLKVANALAEFQSYASTAVEQFLSEFETNQVNHMQYVVGKISPGGFKKNLRKRGLAYFHKRIHETGFKQILVNVKQKSKGKFGYKTIRFLVFNKQKAIQKAALQGMLKKVNDYSKQYKGQPILQSLYAAIGPLKTYIHSEVNKAYTTLKSFADKNYHDWDKCKGKFKHRKAMMKAHKNKKKHKG